MVDDMSVRHKQRPQTKPLLSLKTGDDDVTGPAFVNTSEGSTTSLRMSQDNGSATSYLSALASPGSSKDTFITAQEYASSKEDLSITGKASVLAKPPSGLSIDSQLTISLPPAITDPGIEDAVQVSEEAITGELTDLGVTEGDAKNNYQTAAPTEPSTKLGQKTGVVNNSLELTDQTLQEGGGGAGGGGAGGGGAGGSDNHKISVKTNSGDGIVDSKMKAARRKARRNKVKPAVMISGNETESPKETMNDSADVLFDKGSTLDQDLAIKKAAANEEGVEIKAHIVLEQGIHTKKNVEIIEDATREQDATVKQNVKAKRSVKINEDAPKNKDVTVKQDVKSKKGKPVRKDPLSLPGGDQSVVYRRIQETLERLSRKSTDGSHVNRAPADNATASDETPPTFAKDPRYGSLVNKQPPRGKLSANLLECPWLFTYDQPHPMTNCWREGCGQSTASSDGRTVICPRCGDRSYVRYCSVTHLLADMKDHYGTVCTKRANMLQIDPSTITPVRKANREFIRVAKRDDSAERHRQALYHAYPPESDIATSSRPPADYYLFSDADRHSADPGPDTFAKLQLFRCTGTIAGRVRYQQTDPRKALFATLLERLLALGVSAGAKNPKGCRMLCVWIKENLSGQAEWTEIMITRMCMALRLEFGWTVDEDLRV